MIVPDVNLLVYAVDEESPFHRDAKAWLNHVLVGTEIVGMPWTVLLGFLRVTTRPQTVPKPLTVAQALAVIDFWLAQPSVKII